MNQLDYTPLPVSMLHSLAWIPPNIQSYTSALATWSGFVLQVHRGELVRRSGSLLKQIRGSTRLSSLGCGTRTGTDPLERKN